MGKYILEENPNDREKDRLNNIQKAVDKNTIKLLESTNLAKGKSCLEIGAGGGSILNWLGDRVGPTGKVIGIDKDISHIQNFTNPPYKIIKGDFLDLDLNSSFDLIHCRYVLIHNKDDNKILEKVYSLLNPGGFIVIEEPDFTSSKFLNRKNDINQNRVNEASCDVFINANLNPAYGLNLPQNILDTNFKIIDVNSILHFCNGGSPIAKMCSESVNVLREKFIATGKASKEDIDAYNKNAEDENYWSIYYTTVSVVARKQ